MAEVVEAPIDPAEELNRLLNLELEAAENAEAFQRLREHSFPRIIRGWLEAFVRMTPDPEKLRHAHSVLKAFWLMKQEVELGADRGAARARSLAEERERAAEAAEEDYDSGDV
ncbi:MAG: hypothetical protein JSV79_11990 [Armatimonadota bacterium]|nr:MAG: hypothetical protein JSV79_11990 [Armatimonadota bacterium]